jgi:hypothetical protein
MCQTCPVKTALAVLKTLETAQKNRYSKDLGVGPIEDIYIYVAYGQVLTNKYIYIYIGTIQIINHG